MPQLIGDVTSLKSDKLPSGVKPEEQGAVEPISYADQVRAFERYHRQLTYPCMNEWDAAKLLGQFVQDHA